MSLKHLIVITLAATLFPSFADANLQRFPPAIQKISGLSAEPGIFKAASRDMPLVLNSEKGAAEYFSGKNLAGLTRQVDFEKQFVLVFAWRGSGQDRLDSAVQESFPEQVVFSFKPGRTKDLRPHVDIFALRSNVKWKTAAAAGGGAARPAENDYIKVEIKGTLNSQVFAIGGETTGVTISANGITWELDLAPGSDLRKKAGDLNGKKVLVTGQLTVKRGVERGRRYLIQVKTLESAEGEVQRDVKTSGKKDHKLPADKKAAVIVLQYEGGFTPPRVNKDPELLIQADGTVILGAPFGHKKRLESKISADELQELLRFALDENNVAGFDADSIKKEMAKAGPQIRVADAGTTVIRIHADGKEHEAKFHALSMMARQYPKIKSLSQLDGLRERLEKLRTEISAGGQAGIAKHLKLANAKVKAEHPDVPLLTAKDLQSAWQRATGDMSVNFSRAEKLADDTTRYLSASVEYPAGKEPKVTVQVNLVSMD